MKKSKTKSKTAKRAGRPTASEQTREAKQDDLILAAIVAGAQVNPLRRGTFGAPYRGDGDPYHVVDPAIPSGPCCAVGCSLLFARIATYSEDAITSFAKHHGTSRLFALGVSDGFECQDVTHQYNLEPMTDAERASDAYARGWAVGCAAATLLDGDSWRAMCTGRDAFVRRAQ